MIGGDEEPSDARVRTTTKLYFTNMLQVSMPPTVEVIISIHRWYSTAPKNLSFRYCSAWQEFLDQIYGDT